MRFILAALARLHYVSAADGWLFRTMRSCNRTLARRFY